MVERVLEARRARLRCGEARDHLRRSVREPGPPGVRRARHRGDRRRPGGGRPGVRTDGRRRLRLRHGRAGRPRPRVLGALRALLRGDAALERRPRRLCRARPPHADEDRGRRVAVDALRVPGAPRPGPRRRRPAGRRPGRGAHRGAPCLRARRRPRAAGRPPLLEDRHLRGRGRPPGRRHATLSVLRVPAGAARRSRRCDASSSPRSCQLVEGRLPLPERPGLGVELDRDALDRFELAARRLELHRARLRP